MKRCAAKQINTFVTRDVEHSNVLIVQGARQVGKTYLVADSVATHRRSISINLEELPQIKLAIDQSRSFDEFTTLLKLRFGFEDNTNTLLFIDEAQESQKLGSYVRFMKEKWRHTKTILTGSSMKTLFNETSRIPVGRIEYITIQPFSFREFLRFIGKEPLLDEAVTASFALSSVLHELLLAHFDDYLKVGGMPAVVQAFAERRDIHNVFAFLIASQRDDFLRKESVKSYLFLDALKGIANHVGSTAKYSHIAQNSYDAKKIIQKLVEWFLVYEVQQSGSLSTQSFLPKRYLYDIGLLRYLRDTAIPDISVIHTVDEALRTPLGALIENVVLQNIIHGKGGFIPVSSWKKNNKESIEVDFVVARGSSRIPVEVKACLNAQERHSKNLRHYLKQYGLSEGVLLCLDRPHKIVSDKIEIQVLPAYLSESVLSD